jgi:hypothetical protein
VLALAVVPGTPAIATGPSTADIDRQVWQAVAQSAADHDIAAMARVYHPAAVLVSQKGTMPIAEALDRWGRDMATSKRNGDRASVEFRFSYR